VQQEADGQFDPPAEIDLTSSSEPARQPSGSPPADPAETSEQRAPIPSSDAESAGAATGAQSTASREGMHSTGGDPSPVGRVGTEELVGASSGRAFESDRALAGEPSRTAAPATPEREPGAAGANAAAQANMSASARVADVEPADPPLDPASPRSADVSRETSAGGGEVVKKGREDEPLQDEASIAVREAASRAALEAGVDVSRETDLTSSEGLTEGSYGDLTIDSDAAAKTARVTFRIERDALNGTRRVVAVANQKGGVGKSTTAVNIGAYLALAGARVLVVDLDPQGNASTGLGLDHRDIDPSIYDVLTGDTQPTAAIRTTGVTNLHILPSTIDLAGAEVELVSAMSRETRLRRALQSVDHQYDAVLIDCPPSLGLLTVNALAAADELLIPIQCEYYALEGLGQLLRNVELVRANLNPELRIGGIVLTMYDGRTRLALQVVEEVRKHFTDIVFQTVVPRSVRLSEAPGYGLPIALYDPLSRGGIAYRDLTLELAERSGLLAQTEEGAS
jgi:chromosome partitioning protein